MEAMMDSRSKIRYHWLYETLEVVGVLIVGTLITVGIIFAIGNLILWLIK
jgi:hypothetical protein